MNNHFTAKKILLASLPLLVFFCNANDSIAQDNQKQLRWSLQLDASYDVELKQQTGIKTNIQNRSQEIGNDMTLQMKWNVASVENSVYEINQSISRIRLKVTSPSKGGVQITEIDTGAENEKTTEFGARLLEQIQPLVGTQFVVTMTNRGEIKNVEIPKDSMEKIRSAPASMQLRQVVSEDGLKELIGQSAIVFPENALKPGDKWDTTDTVKNDFASITKNNQYTYNGASESDGAPSDSISVSTKIKAADVSDDNSIENFVGTGKIEFANESDLLLSSQIRNEMTTLRKYRDQKIKSTVTTDVSMRVTKSK